MTKHILSNPIRAGVALGLALLAAGCSQNPPPETEPVAPVKTAAVERSAIERVITARGILCPVDQASVTPKISAPVETFHVKRGDHVRKGQLLAVLENRDLAAAAVENRGMYEQAQAAYQGMTEASLPEELSKAQLDAQSAKEALDAAQKLYESRRELLGQGALPRRQVDEASVAFVQARSQYEEAQKHLEALQQAGKEARIREAQGQVDAAKGRYQGAEAQLEYSQIRSPIEGVVADRPLYAGEMASAGSPLLTVMDVSRVIARANVPSDQLGFLKVGDEATITTPDAAGELHGKVTVVSPALDPASTTAEVWVEAANPGERFRPGMTVEVAILAERVEDAIVIPVAAILPVEGSGIMVLSVDSESVAHEREIETGIRNGDRLQVLSGLEPGEQVVVEGGLGLENQAKVRVVNTGGNNGK